jgi:hypothetical protein
VAFCFWGEALHQDPGQESPYGTDQRYEPQSMRASDLAKNSALFLKSRRVITRHLEQEKPHREAQDPHKQLSAQAADDTQHKGI